MKRYPQFNETDWIRECQECFHLQKDTEPINGMSDAYRNRKCKKCKSDALDYGFHNSIDPDWAEEGKK